MNGIVANLVRIVVGLFARTWRVEVSGGHHLLEARDSGCGVVFALWHSRMVPLLWQHRGESMSMMVSGGRDGLRLSSIVRHWGYLVIEGSSSKGGTTALKQAIRVLEAGGEIAITPDGPTGPAEQSKPGAVQAAQATGARIVPVASAAAWAIRFKTWDGFVIPLPFSRVVISYGRSYGADRRAATSEESDVLSERITAVSIAAEKTVHGPSLLHRRVWRLLRVGIGAPLVPVYWTVSSLHRMLRSRQKRKLFLPSIVIGGPTAGGDGKTPLASWVASIARDNHANPAILIGGYGGDEQVLHRELLPPVNVFSNRDRFRGCRDAARAGATVAVLDDALQRTDIDADLTIGVVAAEHVTGLHLLLPAGRWREPLAGLRRADSVVVTYKTASGRQLGAAVAAVARVTRTVPCVVRLAPGHFAKLDGTEVLEPADLAYKSIMACAGIAAPEEFFQQLENMGAFVSKMAFRDHYHFSDDAIKEMVHKAKGVDYVVVTQKDAVKLRGRWPTGAPEVIVADLQLHWEHGETDLAAQVRQLSQSVDKLKILKIAVIG